MKLIVENSTSVTSFEYNKDTEVLTIEFKNGTMYDYYHVPFEVVSKMQVADSVGKFITTDIKGKFHYERRGDVQVVHGSSVHAAWPFPTYNKP